jgi:RNA polymerase sigma-70 factor (ECF subfamily)
MPTEPRDVTQLEAWYREHGPDLLGYLRRHFGGTEAAEDLLQETFVKALRGQRQALQAASARAWLFGIARHVGLASLRRRRPTAALEREPAADVPPDEDPRLAAVRAAIARLPDGPREALELRVRGELSYEEIADVLSIPIGTVRSRLHHAMQQLRDLAREAD